jgi:hypothetical protein
MLLPEATALDSTVATRRKRYARMYVEWVDDPHRAHMKRPFLEAWTQATEKRNRLNDAEEDEMRAYAIHTAKKKNTDSDKQFICCLKSTDTTQVNT